MSGYNLAAIVPYVKPLSNIITRMRMSSDKSNNCTIIDD